VNGQSQGPGTLVLSPPVTGEYHISWLQRFLVTVLLVFQTYALSSVREKNWEAMYLCHQEEGWEGISCSPVTEISSY
jgi:hypothetical protein